MRPSVRAFANRFGWLIFYPAFLAAASLPVVRVLGIRGAIGFGLLALAWLVFGRLLVFACFKFIIAEISSPQISRVVCSVLVDGIAIYVVCRMDVRCLWGALAAIVLAEALFWWPERSSES